MIYGIGTDIVTIARLKAAEEKHGARFVERILSSAEISEYAQSLAPARLLAKRFAVKEAFSKAFGTGIGEAVSWHDVSVAHDENGKPLLVVSDALQRKLDAANITAMHVSISDEAEHAIAFVVLERK